MAAVGTIAQYQGPLPADTTYNFTEACIIGISINEDDFMSYGSAYDDPEKRSFRFIINGNQIYMGKTYIYQTVQPVTKPLSSPLTISFPDGAPESFLMEIVYCSTL